MTDQSPGSAMIISLGIHCVACISWCDGVMDITSRKCNIVYVALRGSCNGGLACIQNFVAGCRRKLLYGTPRGCPLNTGNKNASCFRHPVSYDTRFRRLKSACEIGDSKLDDVA